MVVPRPILEYANNHPLLSSLCVTEAGYRHSSMACDIERTERSEEALMVVCRSGGGYVELATAEKHRIRAGDAFMIPPGSACRYWAEMEFPWTIQWVSFQGSEIQNWWAWYRFPASGAILKRSPEWAENLALWKIHDHLEVDTNSLLRGAATLRWALSHLMFNPDMSSGAHQKVKRLEEWMRENFNRPLTLKDLSQRAGLSPSHLSSLFQDNFGYSPIDYIIQLRIQKAVDLLSQTQWPIKTISLEVGFEDALYFSRRFKKVVGVSPRLYRKSKV